MSAILKNNSKLLNNYITLTKIIFMEKLIFINFFIFLISLPSYAQNINGVINYSLTVLSDTIHDIELTQNATLFINIEEKKSLYVTRRETDNESVKAPKFTYKKDGSYSIKSTEKPVDKIGELTYKNHITKELVCRDFISDKSFIVTDDYPIIKWEIKDSKKTILNFNCQKAEGDFRGRHYTAWFTDKIPIPDGPWKLCGLPGLILEAYDEKKHIRFELQTVDIPKKFSEIIQVPNEGESINFTDFYVKQKNSNKAAVKRFLAKTGDLDANISVSSNLVEATKLERNIQE